MQKIYETPRLILKASDVSLAEAVLDFHLRNAASLAEWEPVRPDGFFTLGYWLNQLAADTLDNNAGRSLRLWMFPKNDCARCIGAVVLNNIVRGAFLSCYLGYKCDIEERNKGYVTEAVRLVAEVAFGELGLHRIEANIMPRNAASLRVVRKLGFRDEGLARDYLLINGKWEDHIHMVLLNESLI